MGVYKCDSRSVDIVNLVHRPKHYGTSEEHLVAENEHIQRATRNRTQVVLSLTELLSQLETVNGNSGALTKGKLLSDMKDMVETGDKRKIRLGHATTKSVDLLTLKDIEDWSNFARGKEICSIDAICVANRAVSLWRSWDLTTVQILAILLGDFSTSHVPLMGMKL